MAEHLFIRIDEPDGGCASLVLDSDGRAVRSVQRGALSEVAAGTAGRRVVLLVPGPDVVTARVALPAMSQARLRQTLPYSLEDQFAEDIDLLHFAAGARLPSGEVPVSAVARDRLDSWLERLAALGVTPQAVHADTEGVPDTPSTLTLIVDGGRAYGRRPGQAPFVLEDLPLADVLELVTSRDGDAEEIRHVDLYADPEVHASLRDDVEAMRARGVSVEPRALGDGVLGRLATTLLFEKGTNLLQGPYAPKSNVSALARPWYAAAGLAAALLGLVIVAEGVEYVELAREDRALTEWLEQSCRSRFGVSSLSACGTQARQVLSAAGLSADSEGESFLSALATIAELNAPANRIDSLSYRNGEMTLELTADSVPALDELARRVEATERFEVRIQSANPREGGVEGRIRLVEVAR